MTGTAIRFLTPTNGELAGRVRGFLITIGFRLGLIGLLAAWWPGKWTKSPAYNNVRSVMPITEWGIVFIAVSIAAFLIAWRGSEWSARVLLIADSATTAMWATSFTLAYLRDHSAGPLGATLLWALVIKDFLLSGMPLRPTRPSPVFHG